MAFIPCAEVGSIGADELRDFVDHFCSLGTEELICVGAGVDIHRIYDNVPNTHPAEAVAGLVLYPVDA